jgi:hypothetical protein
VGGIVMRAHLTATCSIDAKLAWPSRLCH